MKDINGALWIRKPRQKTGNMSNIPAFSVTKGLIEKYANHPECVKKNVLLPVISNQKPQALRVFFRNLRPSGSIPSKKVV